MNLTTLRRFVCFKWFESLGFSGLSPPPISYNDHRSIPALKGLRVSRHWRVWELSSIWRVSTHRFTTPTVTTTSYAFSSVSEFEGIGVFKRVVVFNQPPSPPSTFTTGTYNSSRVWVLEVLKISDDLIHKGGEYFRGLSWEDAKWVHNTENDFRASNWI